MPTLCSAEAVAISPINGALLRADSSTLPMVALACSTRWLPRSTESEDASIRPLISLAAVAERCASARTSPATTAKPLPCSPARAASTAALSARMLVWNAISSIRRMISSMRCELCEISRMASMACWVSSLP